MSDKIEIGQTYDFQMKPTHLRGWKVIRETPNCYQVEKNGRRNLVPKKVIDHAFKQEAES